MLPCNKKTSLDEEVKMSAVIVAASGSVAAHDLLAVDLCRDRDMLTNRKTEHIFASRK